MTQKSGAIRFWHSLKDFPIIGMLLNGFLEICVADGEKTLTEGGGYEDQVELHTLHPDIDSKLGKGMVGGHGKGVVVSC